MLKSRPTVARKRAPTVPRRSDPRRRRYQRIGLGSHRTYGQRSIDPAGHPTGVVKPSFSEEILGEYAEVLARPKFGFALDEINPLIALLRSQGEEIEKPEPLASSLPDPGDDKFLACAKAASVDFIVTGNKRHFPTRACGAIRVVNAAQLLDRITLEL